MRKYLSLFCCTIIIFCSCQKDDSDQNIVPQNPMLLKKFIALDLSQTAPNDTTGIIEYSYDNLNRCTVIKNTYYPSLETDMTYNYYVGSDTLISSRTIIYNGSDTSKEIFTYNSVGQLLSDSTITILSSSTYTLTYSYQILSNSRIQSTINSNSSPFLFATYNIQYDNNGNHLAEKDSSFDYNIGSGYVYKSVSDLTNTFDTKPCPFYNLYPKRLIGLDYENALQDDQPFYWSIIQKNNILTEVRTTNPTTTGLSPYNHSFSYTYGADNYPLIIKYTDNLTGEHYKGIYIY